jgi:hypothetical protein
MSLLLNIVRKDFLRVRWSLVLLVAVTAVKFGLGWMLAYDAPRQFEAWRETSGVVLTLVVVEQVLTWLMAGTMILADPLVESRAAWRTRPIGVARLLLAKAMGAVLLLGGPGFVLGVPWWIANGFGVAEMAKAATMGLLATLAVVGPSFFVASLVDSMSRYVLWSVAALAGVITLPLLFATLTTRWPEGAGFWAASCTACLLVAIVLVVRFRGEGRRCLPVGVALGVPTIVSLLGVWLATNGRAWSRDVWTEAHVERAGELSLTLGQTTMHDYVRQVPYTDVQSVLGIEGVPAGLAVDVVRTEHTWSGEGVAPVSREGYGYTTGSSWVRSALGLTPKKDDAETVRWQAEHRNDPESKRSPSVTGEGRPDRQDETLRAGAGVPPSVAVQLKQMSPRYRVKVLLRVVKPAKSADVPLQVGARTMSDGYAARVARVERAERDAWVQTVESRPLPWSFLSDYNQGWWSRPTYYALERESGRLTTFNGERSPAIWIGGVELQAHSVTISAPKVVRDGNWTVLDPHWLEPMRLVLVRWDEVARVAREAGTERFVVTK